MKKRVAIGVCLVVLATVTTLVALTIMRPKDDAIALIKAVKTNQTVFYPKVMPEGFSLDATSITASNGTVIYRLVYSGDQGVTVTNQQKPQGIMFEDFYDRVLKNKADVFNRHGKAVIGVADNQTIGSLVSEKTWVLVNAPADIDSSVISQLVGQLAPVSN